MPKCPKCGEELTPEEVKSLWGSFRGSRISPARSEAARRNGRKNKGKKPDQEAK